MDEARQEKSHQIHRMNIERTTLQLEMETLELATLYVSSAGKRMFCGIRLQNHFIVDAVSDERLDGIAEGRDDHAAERAARHHLALVVDILNKQKIIEDVE